MCKLPLIPGLVLTEIGSDSGGRLRIAVRDVQLETAETRVLSRSTAQEVNELKSHIDERESRMERCMQVFSNAQETMNERLNTTDSIVSKLLRPPDQQQANIHMPNPVSSPQRTTHTSQKPISRAILEVSPRVTLQCLAECPCRCHQTFRTAVLRNISTYVGCLFIGYKSLPWSFLNNSTCDEQTCRRSRSSVVTFRWYFPSWFLGLVFEAGIGRSLQPLPAYAGFHVRYGRKTTSPIFIAIISLDIPAVKQLLDSGNASIYDVDENGLGLLWKVGHAQRGNQFEMYRFLLDLGCPSFGEAEVDWSPAENLLVDALGMASLKQPSAFDFDHIATICTFFRLDTYDFWTSWRKTAALSPTHDAMLGLDQPQVGLENFLIQRDLSNTLKDVIDQPDSYGNSALVWAVQYGSPQAVKLLLAYGADKHQFTAGSGIREPLLNLAIGWATDPEPIGDYLGVIKILLEADLDPNTTDTQGHTAIHIAAMWGSLSVVQFLSQNCGDRIDWCAQASEGESALYLTRQYFENKGQAADTELERFLEERMSQQQQSSDLQAAEGSVDSEAANLDVCVPMPGAWI